MMNNRSHPEDGNSDLEVIESAQHSASSSRHSEPITQYSQPSADDDLSAMERLLLEYILDYTRSHTRYYSWSEAKVQQRASQRFSQERQLGDLVERLEILCGGLRGARVLEIGSGSGSRTVAVALRGAEVFGIDPIEAGVAASRLRAARYAGLRAQFEVGVGEELPFPDESFDLVFSTEVLQHVQRMERVIAETARVLRRGGICYHEAPNNLYPREFHYRLFWVPGMPKLLGKLYARLRGKDPRHLDDINFVYRWSLAAMMRRHGFADVRDLYSEEFTRKALRTEAIRSPAKRRVYELLRRLGLAAPSVRLVAALGIHPQVWLRATKLPVVSSSAYNPPSFSY